MKLHLVNAIIEKYRQQRPLPQTFGKHGVCFRKIVIEKEILLIEFFRALLNISQIWLPIFTR